MDVLVTGSSGFIGRHLVQMLAQRGHQVVGLDRRMVSLPLPREIRNLKGEVTRECLRKIARRPDWIFHCAGGGSVGFAENHPEEDFRMNVGTSLEVLAYARNLRPVPRVVFLSSAAVYGNSACRGISEGGPLRPCSSYGFHKLLAEQAFQYYSRRWSIPVAILRLFSVYGEGLQKQIFWDASQKMNQGASLFSGSGKETRDFVHIDDVCRLLLLAPKVARTPAIILNCGRGKAVRLQTALGILARQWRVSKPRFSGKSRPGDPLHLVSDARRAFRLGWKPDVELREGLRRYAAWVSQGKQRGR